MLRSTPFVNLELHDEIKRRLKAKQITLSSIADEAGSVPVPAMRSIRP